MNTKKMLFTVGGFLAVTAPIAAVISCGVNNGKSEAKTPKEIAEQFNELLKTGIKSTNKKIIEIAAQENQQVSAEELGIKEQIDEIGTPGPDNVQKIYFRSKTIDSVTIKSVITYAASTPDFGVVSTEWTISTQELNKEEIIKYNVAKISNSYLTVKSDQKVADLPEIGAQISAQSLGIDELKLEKIDQMKMIIVGKNATENEENSGTVEIDVWLKTGHQETIKNITVFGFAESSFVGNKKVVDKTADDLQNAQLKHKLAKEDVKDGELAIADIEGMPAIDEETTVSLELITAAQERIIIATISRGEGEYQQVTKVVKNIPLTFTTHSEILKSLQTHFQKIDTSSKKFDDFKDGSIVPGVKTYEELKAQLGIEFDNVAHVQYDLKGIIPNSDNDVNTAIIKVGLTLGKDTSEVQFTISNFVADDEENAIALQAELQELQQSSLTFAGINEVTEPTKISYEDLTKNLGITFNDVARTEYNLQSVTKNTDENTIAVVVNLKVGASEFKQAKFTLNSFVGDDEQAAIALQTELEAINQSSLTFAGINEVTEPAAISYKDLTKNLGITFTDVANAQYNLQSVTKNTDENTITVVVNLKVGASSEKIATFTISNFAS